MLLYNEDILDQANCNQIGLSYSCDDYHAYDVDPLDSPNFIKWNLEFLKIED